MSISYDKLWKKLIDNKMQKKDLSGILNISSATIAKMGKEEPVSFEVMEKICTYFNCDIGDVMSFKKYSEREEC